MLMDRIGQCRYCDYEPIANTARACPKCGGASPYEGGFPWSVALIVLLLIALAGAGGYIYFTLF